MAHAFPDKHRRPTGIEGRRDQYSGQSLLEKIDRHTVDVLWGFGKCLAEIVQFQSESGRVVNFEDRSSGKLRKTVRTTVETSTEDDDLA